ncbi:MAG TPA: hypothetical protein VE967_12360 [Gemmatimonadaceae bacterium]|nr:hypothetical protein [Gemmatimonadaceae bacterium]
MAQGLFGQWRAAQGRQSRAERYVQTLMNDPAEGAIRALASFGDGDEDHARWELRYARRAIGLLISERDALDDRTASDVAAALEDAHVADARVAKDKRDVAAQQLNTRLREYRAALQRRADPAPTSERLARVLLTFAGVAWGRADAMALASDLAATIVGECNAALRDAYGEATLPEDVKPSEL